MAWRFKVSKYKNAVGVVPRKEDWLNDIKVGSPQSCGNHIKASAAFMAFNVENRGKQLYKPVRIYFFPIYKLLLNIIALFLLAM